MTLDHIKCNACPEKRDEAIASEDHLSRIWEWNHSVPKPVERCVHEMIQERAQAQPTAPAVCAWDGELNYAELDDYSTRLSYHLVNLNLGIGPEMVVPLSFEKSRWMTVAMLAVLKAGAGFVTLDPALPEHRLASIVAQVEARFILSSRKHQALGARLMGTVVTVSDEEDNSCFVDTIPTTAIRPSPSSIIYVVFTSGSTGTPKGAVIEHRNVASALYHQVERLGIKPQSRFFDFVSSSYDVSISNTLAVLMTGACLCIPSEQDRINNLEGSLIALRANVTALTPSVARLLAPEAVPCLESIMLVGEAVRPTDMTRWERGGKTRVVCRYGVSESPAASTIHERSGYSKSSRGSTCEEFNATTQIIGTGAGLVTWVVDPNDHQVLAPLGSPGELLLEGPSIGRGYLNDPINTSAVFIQEPEWLLRGGPSGNPTGRRGNRLYKTGDLVRYQPDGNLVYLRRKDTQVKIRGQRVELGDVEHHVQECLNDAGQQLVAEVVMLPGPIPRPVLAVFVQTSHRYAGV
ncbi:unnamed protein product [Penicillium glandicola]